jgi:hypothetical protein
MQARRRRNIMGMKNWKISAIALAIAGSGLAAAVAAEPPNHEMRGGQERAAQAPAAAPRQVSTPQASVQSRVSTQRQTNAEPQRFSGERRAWSGRDRDRDFDRRGRAYFNFGVYVPGYVSDYYGDPYYYGAPNCYNNYWGYSGYYYNGYCYQYPP